MKSKTPDHTAVRVALWRALHARLDPEPLVLRDELGAALVGEARWWERPDMQAGFSRAMRASIVGRARFVEDLVEQELGKGVSQYVILGAGLDTFAQRRAELAKKLRIYEVDLPVTQDWKKRRLAECGLPLPEHLRFVPVNFSAGEKWGEKLEEAGFHSELPALVASTGVSLYLTKETNRANFQALARLAKGSTLALTFLLDPELLPEEERTVMEFVIRRAEESGTPFLSLFHPEEILRMAKEAGFSHAEYVSADDLYLKYFAGRPDGLRAGSAEAFLIAKP